MVDYISRHNFNNEKYGDYQALSSVESFLRDKVYLYKIYKQFKNLKLMNIAEVKILDVGCADGSFAKFLKQQGYDVYGIDISSKAINQAVKSGIKASQCDVEQGINFLDNFFDIVIASEVIEHLYDTDYFLQQLKRITKDDGYLLLSTPNLASLKNRIRLLFGRYPQYSEFRLGKNQSGHIRNYTVNTLKLQLEENNWQIIQVISPNFICPMTKNIPVFLKRIAMYLGDIFHTIGSHIIIVAKK